MTIFYLQHATSPRNLDSILKNGLLFNPKGEKLIKIFGDDGYRYIWFDFISAVDERIIYSDVGIGSTDTDMILVLDYQKMTKFVRSDPELEIKFSTDYVKFTDCPDYVNPSSEKELEKTLEVVLETRKEHHQNFDIRPFLRYIYTCGKHALEIKEILRQNSLSQIKVYKADKDRISGDNVKKILKRDDVYSRNFINKFISDDSLPFILKKLLCYQLFFMTECTNEV